MNQFTLLDFKPMYEFEAFHAIIMKALHGFETMNVMSLYH